MLQIYGFIEGAANKIKANWHFCETYPYFCKLNCTDNGLVSGKKHFPRGLSPCAGKNKNMMKKEINFDRFVRGLLLLAGLAATVAAITYLSSVLIPFFIAWLVAYLLYPIVSFLQNRCRLRNRFLCIVITLALVCGALGGLVYLSVPPLVEECVQLKDVALRYIEQGANNRSIPQVVQTFIDENASRLQLDRLLREKDVIAAVKNTVPKVWDVLLSTANVIFSMIASLIALLYLFFLLTDYEKYAKGWIRFVPASKRGFAKQLATDVECRMGGYFRGQLLIALSNCVMFSAGFMLIDFPMPVVLGCFIGLISFVPYVQVVGILPATVLALLKAAYTGENFWWLMGGVILVYLVVQILQDIYFTPKIMGKIMGLPPAVILLSLSVWGYMLGIIGLIIALPVTTLAISYYKRYVVPEDV